ncbi:MAG: bifunctional UDP-N-acetylglucosamine diphosphorylase/glucosamine-1-phosphate N-acetyltransferase GlmU [Rhodobacteraceae bacterium]|nr:bifunctional UDP-N-acetylglucosamine diphosphorylase/glucosamine-1-phosphate N-acetyltransferase GlmU [Paracoccaceae bacterium]
MSLAVIILAAGHGRRMRSALPKVLHQIGHAPLLHHAMDSAGAVNPDMIVVVAGHGEDGVAEAARAHTPDAVIVTQKDRLGTGHAVAQAKKALGNCAGDVDVIVLYGDTPFISADSLHRLLAAYAGGAAAVVMGFEAADPGRYGRLKTGADGMPEAIVEAGDASEAERAITLCNSGIMAASAQTMFTMIGRTNRANAGGEYYLTDVIAEVRKAGMKTAVVTCAEAETRGVNSRADLALAEAVFQARKRAEAMENGVTLTAPATVHFARDTRIGRDVTIGPNVVFGPGVTVDSGALIRAFSHLEGCHVSPQAIVGPYARLRPGAEIGSGARIGNFVEIKGAVIGTGARVNHLSYLGDASVGAEANIGAGTITCNYDGVSKHGTEIGARAFIGSNTALVAPVRLGAGGMTGAGSVITDDVPDGALAIARAGQTNRPNLARRLMRRLRAARKER